MQSILHPLPGCSGRGTEGAMAGAAPALRPATPQGPALLLLGAIPSQRHFPRSCIGPRWKGIPSKAPLRSQRVAPASLASTSPPLFPDFP